MIIIVPIGAVTQFQGAVLLDQGSTGDSSWEAGVVGGLERRGSSGDALIVAGR